MITWRCLFDELVCFRRVHSLPHRRRSQGNHQANSRVLGYSYNADCNAFLCVSLESLRLSAIKDTAPQQRDASSLRSGLPITMSDTAKLLETESVKRFAFLGVTISTVATLTAIVAVPMLCLYMQHIQSGLQDELNFCRSRGDSVKAEFNKLASVRQAVIANRRSIRAAFTGCCSCGTGPPGPPGPPGRDGTPGRDGIPGAPGAPGADAPPGEIHPKPEDFCFECEPSPPGPPGPAGMKGPDGMPGAPGPQGPPGRPGFRGPPGPQGPPGSPGPDGQPGPAGQPGQVRTMPSPAGEPGPPGEPGPKGPPGPDGRPGLPGRAGAPGAQGEPGPDGEPGKDGEDGPPGEPGKDGAPGSCDHCPVPRTAPGY